MSDKITIVPRRSFLAYAVGMLAAVAPVLAQQKKTVMENGKAVMCDGDTFKCGACGHDSCRVIDAHMAIGNENANYPETSVLFDYRFVACENCNVLSVRKV